MMKVNLTPDLVSKEQLIGKIQKDMDQTMLVYALLVCATLIASIGLNYNSTTTIIGAMLISPLLNGINGIGFGLGLSMVKEFCDKNKLKKLIALRCQELNEQLTTSTTDIENINSKVIFWFIRAFFFLDESEVESYWKNLKSQEKIIFILSDFKIGINDFYN